MKRYYNNRTYNWNALYDGDPSMIIVEWLDTEDHIPGSASCPHCGATGTTVYRFRCADGAIRGAMRGCVKLFTVDPCADSIRRCRSLLKRYPGWKKIERQLEDALTASHRRDAALVQEVRS